MKHLWWVGCWFKPRQWTFLFRRYFFPTMSHSCPDTARIMKNTSVCSSPLHLLTQWPKYPPMMENASESPNNPKSRNAVAQIPPGWLKMPQNPLITPNQEIQWPRYPQDDGKCLRMLYQPQIHKYIYFPTDSFCDTFHYSQRDTLQD